MWNLQTWIVWYCSFLFFFHFQFLWYYYNCLNICNVLVDVLGIFCGNKWWNWTASNIIRQSNIWISFNLCSVVKWKIQIEIDQTSGRCSLWKLLFSTLWRWSRTSGLRVQQDELLKRREEKVKSWKRLFSSSRSSFVHVKDWLINDYSLAWLFFSLSYKQSSFWCFGVSVMNMVCICTLDKSVFCLCWRLEIGLVKQENTKKGKPCKKMNFQLASSTSPIVCAL